MKKKFIALWNDAMQGRAGSKQLLAHLEESGFFESPCSGAYHLCKEGGLLEHTINVAYLAMKINDMLDARLDVGSVVRVALLHDIGKIGDYGKPNYVPNMVRSKSKNADGEYYLVQSEAKPYETNKDLLYIDHEIRSLMIARRYIALTEDEEFAILYHNGLYGNLKYAISGKETPLYMVLHFADMWASRVTEKEGE